MTTDQIAAEAEQQIEFVITNRTVDDIPAEVRRIIKSAMEKVRPMVTLKPHIRSVTDVVESAENVAFSISCAPHAIEK